MRIGITMGDPAGVGPELVARTLASDLLDGHDVVVWGDAGVLARAAARLCIAAKPARIESLTELADVKPGAPDLIGGGRAQVAYLEAAAAAARAGAIDALVTAPIHKESCLAAGFAFPGHTEFLAERLGRRHVAMMLAGPRLRVVLATTHIALADVPRRLTIDGIARTLAFTVETLRRDFGIAAPRVGVAGLNPHAGEGGHFGREEPDVIAPAIAAVVDGPLAETMHFTVAGPLVPDAAFRQGTAPPVGEGRFDAVVAMYHDQGLIPVKLVDFDEAVNVTLGLPIVRTSPDHGVAYDIAGTGRARDASFRAAVRMALEMAARRRAK